MINSTGTGKQLPRSDLSFSLWLGRVRSEWRGHGRILNDSGKVTDPARPTLGTVTESDLEKIVAELINTDLELIKAQSNLDATQAAANDENDPHFRQTLIDLRLNLEALVKRREYQAKYYSSLKVAHHSETDDSVDRKILDHQLEALQTRENNVKALLEQLDFDSSRGHESGAGRRGRDAESPDEQRPAQVHAARADRRVSDADRPCSGLAAAQRDPDLSRHAEPASPRGNQS